MINIIMPAYNAHETIKQAIASVAVQDNQENIKLTIVDDCSDERYDYLLDKFDYLNLNILQKPFNSGCGQARQYGIDHTDCEYFMFLDADDCLYSPDSVKTLLAIIKDGDYDVVSSVFLEESEYSDEYIIHKNDFLWMHGKIYRTQYIKERNIRFNETRTKEDNAYNTIISNTKAKIHHIDRATYVWKNNKQSLMFSGNYFSDNINDYIINAEYAINESKRLNVDSDILKSCMCSSLITIYGYFIMFLNEQKNENIVEKILLRIKTFFEIIPNDINGCLLNQLFHENDNIKRIINNNMTMKPTFCEFINMLKEI